MEQVLSAMYQSSIIKVVLGLIVAIVLVQGVSAGEYYKLIDSWGGFGTGNGQFQAPISVTTDTAGNVYVSDNVDFMDMLEPEAVSRIQKFDQEGNYLTEWSPSVSGDYLLFGVSGLTTGGPSEYLYANVVAIVPPEGDDSIVTVDCYVGIYDDDGNLVDQWGPYASGTLNFIEDTLELEIPIDIAVDAEGNAYVTALELTLSDAPDRVSRVRKFTSPAGEMSILRESRIEPDGELDLYLGTDIDSSGTGLMVTKFHGNINTGEGVVSHVQTLSTETGNTIGQWDIHDIGDEQPDMITGIAVGPDGSVFVIDQPYPGMSGEPVFLQKYDSEGNFVCLGEGFGTGEGGGENEFLMAGFLGIEAGPTGDVYVVDPTTYQVLKFREDFAGGPNTGVGVIGPPGIEPGYSITYTIRYHNLGTETAYVVIEDFLDYHVSLISASEPYIYDSLTNSVKWEIGTLNPGEHGTITLVVEVPSFVPEGTTITNRVEMRSTIIDSDPSDNEGTTGTVVLPSVLPPGVRVTPSAGYRPVSVHWQNPLTFSYYPSPDSCIQSVRVTVQVGSESRSADLTLTPDGVWRVTMAPLYPLHGDAIVTFHIVNSCKPDEEIVFDMYIDPAGYVYDIDTGTRIQGASVWLQRPDGSGGWENVPAGSLVMQPDINPLITNEFGQYQWDVLEGFYRVHVEAPGYSAANSIVVYVPPPVTDLHVGLKKEEIPPMPVPEFPSISIPVLLLIGFIGILLINGRINEN